MRYQSNIDPNDIPVVINLKRNFHKKAQSLTGFCSGIMCDNALTKDEILHLRHILLEFSDLLYDWPHSFLLAKINSILEDGIVTKEEIKDFEETLRNFIGGTLSDTGAVSGLSATLPIDEESLIIFPQKTFCFTGQFKYGTRAECAAAVESKGGLVRNSVITELDYLIIGELASRDWIETNYGRKIQKAMDMRKLGRSKVAIIGESDWILTL